LRHRLGLCNGPGRAGPTVQAATGRPHCSGRQSSKTRSRASRRTELAPSIKSKALASSPSRVQVLSHHKREWGSGVPARAGAAGNSRQIGCDSRTSRGAESGADFNRLIPRRRAGRDCAWIEAQNVPRVGSTAHHSESSLQLPGLHDTTNQSRSLHCSSLHCRQYQLDHDGQRVTAASGSQRPFPQDSGQSRSAEGAVGLMPGQLQHAGANGTGK
jgi:hypothetical protein